MLKLMARVKLKVKRAYRSNALEAGWEKGRDGINNHR